MINQVSILGNLATAPRQEVLPSGTVKVSFLLAYNSYYTDRSGQQQEKAEFFWVETFGRSAVNASKFLVQGQQVAVAGQLSGGNIRLENGSYRNCTVIRAEQIEYLSKPQSRTADPDVEPAVANVEI